MIGATIVDRGPLVSLLSRDTHHARCVDVFASLTGRPLVPSTVMVEVCWQPETQSAIEAALLDAIAADAFDHSCVPDSGVTRLSSERRGMD